MPREYQDYRPYREMISELYPGRLELRVSTEVAPMLGIKPRTVYDRYSGLIFNGSIGVVQLARALCDEEKAKKRRRRCIPKENARTTSKPGY